MRGKINNEPAERSLVHSVSTFQCGWTFKIKLVICGYYAVVASVAKRFELWRQFKVVDAGRTKTYIKA